MILITLLGLLSTGQTSAVAETTLHRPQEPMTSAEALRLRDDQKRNVVTRQLESRELISEQVAKEKKAPSWSWSKDVHFYATNNTGYNLSARVSGGATCSIFHDRYVTIGANDSNTQFVKRNRVAGIPSFFTVHLSIDDVRYTGYEYSQSIKTNTGNNHNFYITIKATPGTADAYHQIPWLKLMPSLTKSNYFNF